MEASRRFRPPESGRMALSLFGKGVFVDVIELRMLGRGQPRWVLNPVMGIFKKDKRKMVVARLGTWEDRQTALM